MTAPGDGRHQRRRDRLRELLDVSAPGRRLIVTDLANVRYLTGFSGSNAVLVIAPQPDHDLLGTDGRYRDQVVAQAPDLPVVLDRDTLHATIARSGAAAYSVETTMSVGDVEQLRDEHGLVEVCAGLVEQLRRIKGPDELDALERACAVTVQAFAALAEEIRVGDTELTLARRLEQLFGELGAEDRAFDSIVGSGPNSAIPHHEPGSRRLRQGDLLVIDAGARVDGYHADMTRTFVVGTAPTEWQAEIHAAVARAQRDAAMACLPGAQARDIDAVARGIVEAAGFADEFTHGLGHGVGLEIHEAPIIGARSTGTLDTDMAITVEPGVYLTGRGGVRIEDTLVVADAGPRILTEASRDLVVVG